MTTKCITVKIIDHKRPLLPIKEIYRFRLKCEKEFYKVVQLQIKWRGS